MIENNRVEFKKELNDKLEKEFVGFLNSHEGGAIYIGMNDFGNSVGIDNIDKTQAQIIDRVKDGILPSTLGLFDVGTEEIQGKEVIKITISSGTEKPYYIKRNGMSPKGCFIRIGNTTHPMAGSMIDDLYSRRTRNSLSKIRSPRQDLSFAQLKIYYEEIGLMLNDNFANNLELLTEDGKYNYNAYLFSDSNGLSMKVAKYLGKDKVDLIENQEYGYCSIIKATYNILNKLEIENITKARITNKQRIEKNLVDSIALREAVINAIVHNDYSQEVPPLVEIFSNRIVITSTGSLPQSLTRTEFLSGISAPRNKEIMRIFKDLKLVEHLGSGVKRILDKYDESIFDISTNFMRVTFAFEEISDGINDGINGGINGGIEINDRITLNENQQRILNEFNINPSLTQEEIAEKLGISLRTVQRNISELQKYRLIKRIGSRKSGHWEILTKLK